MADSIAGTVTAILCVVVGLLIIGTALVPIVEHASTSEGETISGSNEYMAEYENDLAIKITDPLTIRLDENGTTINGKPIQGTIYISNEYLTRDITTSMITPNSIMIYSNATIPLSEGEISLTPDQAIITGIVYNEDYDATVTLSDPYLSSSSASYLTSIPGEIYSWMQECTIGEGQTLLIALDDFSDYVEITTSTVTLPSMVTLVKNGNGTVTVSTPEDSAIIFGPIEWTQKIVESSKYAALYGIIPVMLILSMAYVLIRRL